VFLQNTVQGNLVLLSLTCGSRLAVGCADVCACAPWDKARTRRQTRVTCPSGAPISRIDGICSWAIQNINPFILFLFVWVD
jgi:hypothetical protein